MSFGVIYHSGVRLGGACLFFIIRTAKSRFSSSFPEIERCYYALQSPYSHFSFPHWCHFPCTIALNYSKTLAEKHEKWKFSWKMLESEAWSSDFNTSFPIAHTACHLHYLSVTHYICNCNTQKKLCNLQHAQRKYWFVNYNSALHFSIQTIRCFQKLWIKKIQYCLPRFR